jgi:hypothetical protein
MKRKIVLALFLFTTFTACAQGIAWTKVANAQRAFDLFDGPAGNISLSPNGELLVAMSRDYENDVRLICIFTIATATKSCTPLTSPELEEIGYLQDINPFVWSPDSSRILFTEDFYDMFVEADLWTLDVQTGIITNLTPDAVFGSIMSIRDNPTTIDLVPAYAANGAIYFFRGIRQPGMVEDASWSLQRLPAKTQTPELVTELTFMEADDMIRSATLSPDGNQLVFGLEADNWRIVPRNGLWLVDLGNGQTRQLTDNDDQYVGAPEASLIMRLGVVGNPVWSGAGIVFQVHMSGGIGIPYPNGFFLYVDVASGDVRPVINVSDLPPLADITDAAVALRYPRAGAISADGSSFVYLSYNNDRSVIQIAAVPLPPNDSQPTVLGTVPYEPVNYVSNLLVGSNGQALMAGWLYSLAS